MMEETGGNDQSGVIHWDPASVITQGNDSFALLVLNQPLNNLPLLDLVWRKANFRIAADGGGNRIYQAIQNPQLADLLSQASLDVIHGDLDSLLPSTSTYFSTRGTEIALDPDQNSTDFTKCHTYIRAHHSASSDIVVMGGLGGRVDQGMATLNQLYMFQGNYETTGRIYLLGEEGITFVLRRGRHRVRVKGGREREVFDKHVGIIPLKEACFITTRGLEWDVENWRTEFGGQVSTSNHVREEFVEIETNGDVLFTIDLKV